MLERLDEVLVERLRLLVAAAQLLGLLLEAAALLVGVVELGERVGDLEPADDRPPSARPAARSERWRFANGDISTG